MAGFNCSKKKHAFGICLVLLVMCMFIGRITYSRHLHKLLCHVQSINIDKSPEELVAGGKGGEIQERQAEEDMDDIELTALLETHNKGQKRRLPQAIIIGVRKCGTRALLEMLKMHPQIAAASEEVHFFDNNYDHGMQWYKHRMPYSYPDQITIEKSPAYFITEEAPERIFKMSKDVKLLVILRDPTTRAISDYTQIFSTKLQRGKDIGTFEEMAMVNGEINTKYKAVQISIYEQYIKKWQAYFPRKQMHFVDGGKLISNPYPVIKDVERFLGLSDYITSDNFVLNKTRNFYCLKSEKLNKCLSESKGRPHPEVSPYVLEKLREFFRPYNLLFFDRIGMKFDWS